MEDMVQTCPKKQVDVFQGKTFREHHWHQCVEKTDPAGFQYPSLEVFEAINTI